MQSKQASAMLVLHIVYMTSPTKIFISMTFIFHDFKLQFPEHSRV